MKKQKKQKVIVGGWGSVSCDHCKKENIAGVLTMFTQDTPELELCNDCLKQFYEEIKPE